MIIEVILAARNHFKENARNLADHRRFQIATMSCQINLRSQEWRHSGISNANALISQTNNART